MIKSFTLTIAAFTATLLLATGTPFAHEAVSSPYIHQAVTSPIVHQASTPAPCSKVCRVPPTVCADREAFNRAMVTECTDDDTGTTRICSKCNGRTNNPRDTLRNCMLLTARPGLVFGVPRGDVNVLAHMDRVSVFDATVRQGALTWRGNLTDSLVCKAGSDDDATVFLGKVEKTVFAQGIKAKGKGTVKNPSPFFGPRFFISKGSISLAGEMRNNRFGNLEAEGRITIRNIFENNKIKAMTARSGFGVLEFVTGNKFGRVSALTPATAPDFESNFDVERISFRGRQGETVFTDNEAKLLRVQGSCNIKQGSVVGDNTADKFRGDDKSGCGEIFEF